MVLALLLACVLVWLPGRRAAASGASSASNAVAPPSLTLSLEPAGVPVGSPMQIGFSLSYSGVNSLTGVSFTTSLPAELRVATPNGLSTTCSGTATAVAGSSSVSLSGATINSGASCSISLSLVAFSPGSSQVGPVIISSNEATNNISNAVQVTVFAPVSATVSFSPSSVTLNGPSTLDIHLNNPNQQEEATFVALTDDLPPGLVIANPNGLINSCLGTVAATPSSSSISLSSAGQGTYAQIHAAGSCDIEVNVVGTSLGAKSDATSAVSSATVGTGSPSNTAVLNVVPAATCAGGTPYRNFNGNWTAIPGAVSFLAVDENAVLTTSVWALGTNAVPGGCGIYQYVGGASTWVPINGGATSLTVDNTGQPWALQANGGHAIYRYNGGFSAIPGAAYEISAGAGGDVWVIGTNLVGPGGHGIYRYVGAPTYWQAINGSADHIAVAPDNSVWVLQTNGAIYHYSGGVSGTWTAIPGQAQQVSVGYDGSVYVVGTNAIGSNYGIYKYVGGAAVWQAINGAAIQIVGGGAGEFWVHQGGSIPAVPNSLTGHVNAPVAPVGTTLPAPITPPAGPGPSQTAPSLNGPQSIRPTPAAGNRLPSSH